MINPPSAEQAAIRARYSVYPATATPAVKLAWMAAELWRMTQTFNVAPEGSREEMYNRILSRYTDDPTIR